MYFTGVHLTGVRFTDVYLMGVHLINVHLTGVYLISVYLIGVCLIGVYLIGVYLTGVHVSLITEVINSRSCLRVQSACRSCLLRSNPVIAFQYRVVLIGSLSVFAAQG